MIKRSRAAVVMTHFFNTIIIIVFFFGFEGTFLNSESRSDFIVVQLRNAADNKLKSLLVYL